MSTGTTIPIQIRVDKKTKKEASELFEELGTSMSGAVNMFLKQCVNTGSIPFCVRRACSGNELPEVTEEANPMVSNLIVPKYENGGRINSGPITQRGEMDRGKIIELENVIFEHHAKAKVAANAMADFMGVIIGVKPAAITYFEIEDFVNIDSEKIIELLDQIGLKALFFAYEYISMGQLKSIEEVYISRDTRTAIELREAFQKMRSSIDDFGQFSDEKKWEESSRRIGRLLGYPDTAIEYFITERDIDNPERQSLMAKYRFYAHSPEHHEQEYRNYDRKIYQALQDYAPRTAKIFSANQRKMWL